MTSTLTRHSSAQRILGRGHSLLSFLRYNAGQVFAGKFLYFMLLGLVLFLFVAVIYVLEEATPPGAEAIYYFLLVPGTLLVFYPSAFAIQSDTDAGMIETLFGIPDYRYKVWLARSFTQYLVIAALLWVLAVFCRLALADFRISLMIFHLMFPIFFLGSLGFMWATITRNGNGTAVIMVVIVLFFWIASEPLEGSRWNLFHNPFTPVEAFDVLIWEETTLYNRIYLLVGALLANMFALLRLQKREKFI